MSLVLWGRQLCYFANAAEVDNEGDATPAKKVKIEGAWSNPPDPPQGLGKKSHSNSFGLHPCLSCSELDLCHRLSCGGMHALGDFQIGLSVGHGQI